MVFEFRNGSKTGLKVGIDVVDPDHPQNFVGRVKTDDPQSLLDARPDRAEPEVERLLNPNPYTHSGSGVVTVTEQIMEELQGIQLKKLLIGRTQSAMDVGIL